MVELNDAMNLAEILDQLADIDVPPPVSYAPETVGWAVLALVILALAGTITLWLRKRRQANLYRRIALAELERLTQGGERTAAAVLGEAAALVKRTALSVYPRHQVAPLHGSAWSTFIQSHSKVADGQGLEALVSGPYRPNPGDIEHAIAAARQWILTHHV